jgi:uncharacterized protein (TIGR03437 family)
MSPNWCRLAGLLLVLCACCHAAFDCVPDIPPRAALIQVSAPDAAGTAVVTGRPGAVLPGSRVILVTLETGHLADALAGGDGGFVTRLFAPAGTSITVKAGPPRAFFNDPLDALKCYPATIVHAVEPPPVQSGVPVAGAGRTHPGQDQGLPAWTFQGSMSGQQFASGDTLRLRGVLRMVSAVLETAGAMSAGAQLHLERLSGADGLGSLAHNSLASALLTPTGLPIERTAEGGPSASPFDQRLELRKRDATTAESAVDLSFTLRSDLPAGFYRPFIRWGFAGVPREPPNPVAPLMNRAQRQQPGAVGLYLPIIRIGNPSAPRLFWTLLTDELSNGTRGTRAIEDRNRFSVATHVLTQSETLIVPVGSTYRLEPFAPTISVADHSSLQSIPLIPFRFPSGRLTVRLQQPDGSVVAIGPAPFVQARMRSLEDEAFGLPAGGNLQEVYQLSTLDPRFEATFTQHGLHVITLEGNVEDIWGNTWNGGGTYHVYVARTLSLDTAVLPGTPFEVGDVFAPGLTVTPPAAAEVEVRFQLLPNSDPQRRIERTVRGRANRFGYFHPSGGGIPIEQAGEYRVDVTASFRDRQGRLWMGSRTWGGVVAPRNPKIIVHGQRGTDELTTGSPQWFTRTQIGIPIGGDHVKFAFHSGDVMWLQNSDSVRPTITFQDPGGTLTALLRGRYPPAAAAIGEIPLTPSRPDGQDPHLDPARVDLWAYAYTSVQRPLVRVREEILGGNTAAPYWRFREQYGFQIGTGREGDLENDIKFQYGGAVLRGSALPQPEYGIYGSLFVLVRDDDPLGGTRVFPPFQGNGGGPTGGPIMKLKGKDIDLFVHLTGVKPGTVLETGDTFALAGAVGPTLPALISYVVTTPGGRQLRYSGRANKIGYYYRPEHDFAIGEAGIYTVDMTVIYDGQTSAGQVTQPFPRGDVLGTENGRFYFYATPRGARLLVTDVADTPVLRPGQTTLDLTADAEAGHITAIMPGFLLESKAIAGSGGQFRYRFDARALRRDFPNLDIDTASRHIGGDLVTISLFDPVSTRARVVVLYGQDLGYPEPPPALEAVVNAATLAPNAPVAPGGLASLFGAALGPETASAASLPLPTTLGGATVRMNNIEAPLLYASPEQINFQVPWELAGQSQASLSVSGSPPLTVNLAPVSPGIFAAVPQGRFLTLYCTGLGDVTNRPASGAAALAEPLSVTVATPAVTVGGVPAAVLFSGLAPGFVGLYQVNVELRENTPTGNAVPVVLVVGGVASNTVTATIQLEESR